MPYRTAVSLPLHAAGDYPCHRTQEHRAGATVLDRTVSSYIPTLAALRRARDLPPQPDPPPHGGCTPRRPAGLRLELPNVGMELECLTRFPPGNGNGQLVGELATRGNVLAQMSVHDWIHIACHAGPLHAYRHGSHQPTHGFALCDDDLTVAAFAGQPKGQGGLAFLSACQTASPDAGHRDEALHLAGAISSSATATW